MSVSLSPKYFTMMLLLCLQVSSFAQGKKTKIQSEFRNSALQVKKPYVILISGDGFRYDYMEKYKAKNLLKLSAGGVRAKYMVPSFPSVTNPNHYTLVTGLYPGHHGIMGNSFYDPSTTRKYDKSKKAWFTSESIWETASKQQMLSANMNWIAGRTITKDISGVYQSDQKPADMTTAVKVAQISEWLSLAEDQRPHLITLYFNNTDHAGHDFGPDSPETAKAVAEIDEAIGLIELAVRKTGMDINIIFVSDHGMIQIDKKDALALPSVIDTTKFVVNNQNSLINLYAKDKGMIKETYDQLKKGEGSAYKVYLNSDFPSQRYYGGADDRFKRAGDMILVAVWPKTFNPKPGPGMHGFDPAINKQMGATFAAWGPAFKSGLIIEPFQNTEIYGLLAQILGLAPAKNDGEGKLGKAVLK